MIAAKQLEKLDPRDRRAIPGKYSYNPSTGKKEPKYESERPLIISVRYGK